jgi:hypothetical protein
MPVTQSALDPWIEELLGRVVQERVHQAVTEARRLLSESTLGGLQMLTPSQVRRFAEALQRLDELLADIGE